MRILVHIVQRRRLHVCDAPLGLLDLLLRHALQGLLPVVMHVQLKLF